MGKCGFFTSALMLMWMAGIFYNPGGLAVQLYLPEDTFIIPDTRFIPPLGPLIPVNPPLLQTDVPIRSFQPSRYSPEQSRVIPQRPFLLIETPQQQTNFVPQNSFASVDPHRQPNDFALQTPPRQPTRVRAGIPQQPKPPLQTGHRFSARPNESQRIIPQNHRVESNFRKTPKPQENTIRRPSNRHYLCGVVPPPGDCRAAFPRYFYNNKTDQCDCFLYGGCGSEGLEYSYQTLEECHSTCLPANTEEGPMCREIFHEDEVFLHTPVHNLPRPVPTNQNLPEPIPTPDQRYPIVDSSHIPDKSFLILLMNSAANGNRDAYNTDFDSNVRRYK